MAYTINQGVILKYKDARTCDVMQTPDYYLVSNVRLPQVLASQIKPSKGSTVLYAMEDSFKAYIIAVIRESSDFVKSDKALRGGENETKEQLDEGEVFFEARGNPLVPGFGATFHMANDGTITLHSGQQKECLILGGQESDEDALVLLQGDNGFFQSNISDLPSIPIQSTFNFDEDNNLQIANKIVDTTGTTATELELSELTMDKLGNIKLQNKLAGITENAVLDMNISGSISLKNLLADVSLSPLGALDLTATTNLSLTGLTINLNNGVFGVARLNDIVTSNLTTDPAWWLFWSTIASTIGALPTTPLDGGASLKAGLAALFGTIPQTILSKITTASTTVKAGG